MSERDQFEAWAKRTGACSKSIGFNKCLFPGSDVYDDPVLQGYWSAWQASREALKAEQGEDSELLAAAKKLERDVDGILDRIKQGAVDGWISCADSMPESGVKVLCFPEGDEPIHAIFNGQLWLQDVSWSVSPDPIDNVIPTNVTHWQPLPSPPAINHPIDTTPNQYEALGKGHSS